jgi:hypothetical protein
MNKFLVLFNDKFFFSRRTPAGTVVGTLYPSVGRQMDYLVAVEIADKLRADGYDDAIPATIFGRPVLPSDLEISSEKIIDDLETAQGVQEAWGSEV